MNIIFSTLPYWLLWLGGKRQTVQNVLDNETHIKILQCVKNEKKIFSISCARKGILCCFLFSQSGLSRSPVVKLGIPEEIHQSPPPSPTKTNPILKADPNSLPRPARTFSSSSNTVIGLQYGSNRVCEIYLFLYQTAGYNQRISPKYN